MPNRKPSDFRYNTGPARVPWLEVGEDYTAEDVVEVVKFLIQKKDGGYEAAAQEVERAIRALAAHGEPPGKLSGGDRVAELEAKVNAFLGTRHCAFISNATAGFEIAYRYANLQRGDEVIAPAITFIATVAYPLAVGARVVFADVDPRTLNLDPREVERKITPRTKVIIPVHLGGWPVDMDPLMALAERHGLLVIEDAAHAFGSVYRGRKAGTIGHFGAFSFHEVKNITSFGEGGLVTSRLPAGESLKKARFFGIDYATKVENWLYNVVALEGKNGPSVAGNASATEIQALGLLRQLERIEAIIARRKRNAEYLNRRFAENGAIVPQLLDTEEVRSTHHLYLLQIDPEKAGGDIQELKRRLKERGVVNIPHFAPLYKFGIFKTLGYDVDSSERQCPAAEEAFDHRFTHLPLYGLSGEQFAYMADSILESVAQMQGGAAGYGKPHPPAV